MKKVCNYAAVCNSDKAGEVKHKVIENESQDAFNCKCILGNKLLK